MEEQGTEPPTNTSPKVSELIKFNKINNVIKAFFRKKKNKKKQIPEAPQVQGCCDCAGRMGLLLPCFAQRVSAGLRQHGLGLAAVCSPYCAVGGVKNKQSCSETGCMQVLGPFCCQGGSGGTGAGL